MTTPNNERDLDSYFPKELRTQIIVVKKKTVFEFILTELCVFVALIFIFFFCALFTSNFLRNEPLFLKFVDAKFKSLDVTETIIIATASLAVIGALNLIQRAVPNESFVASIIDSVINQIPKLFYTLSAWFIGVVLAIICYTQNNPEPNSSLSTYIASIFIMIVFGLLCGTGLAFLLNHKNLLKSDNTKIKPSSD